MKAAYIERTGPPENIVIGERPKPQASDGQVLVKVEAVDVNPIDTYVRSGMVAMPLPIPYIIGCDLAGTVEAVGRGDVGSSPAIGCGDRTRDCGGIAPAAQLFRNTPAPIAPPGHSDGD